MSTTVTRGCSIGGCSSSRATNTTSQCCNTDLCNSAQTNPPPPTYRRCYSCFTTGNTTSDPCYAGTSSSPVMSPVDCATGVSYCYRETLSIDLTFSFFFIF